MSSLSTQRETAMSVGKMKNEDGLSMFSRRMVSTCFMLSYCSASAAEKQRHARSASRKMLPKQNYLRFGFVSYLAAASVFRVFRTLMPSIAATSRMSCPLASMIFMKLVTLRYVPKQLRSSSRMNCRPQALRR